MRDREKVVIQVSPRDAARQVAKNWWVVLCLALAALLGATGLGMLVYTPEYTASATLVIRVKGSDAYTTLAQTTQMTAVYSEIFQSDALRKVVSESIGEDAAGTIACAQIQETNLLVLSTTSPTPRQAYLFIHAALRNYEQVAGYVFTNAALEIVQEPSVPETPSNASFLTAHRLELTALAALAAAAAIVMIYTLRQTVKTVPGASALLDGTVLGTVPYEKKQRVKGRAIRGRRKKAAPALLIHSPLTSMDFAEAGRRAATRIEAHLRRKGQQVILITSVEENEGKSTVAANIALALAEHGAKVLLLDGDLRKPAQHIIFDKAGQKHASFSDAAEGVVPLDDALVHNEKTGLWELFQYKASAHPGAVLNAPYLPELLDALRERMDYIIVDCSPVAVAADAEIWMHRADTAALVVRQDRADARVINDTVDLIWKSTGDFSGFVLNAFRKEKNGAPGYGG